MNKSMIYGRLAVDPELKQTATGIMTTSFAMAVDRPGTYGNNKKTDWIDVVAWRGTAEYICKHFAKGDPIIVEGTLTSRNWEDKMGQKRKSIEVVASSVFYIPRGNKNAAPEQPTADDFAEIEDEDIPF